MLADIAQVRPPGGHFLRSKRTRLVARSGEIVPPTLTDRHPYEAWVDLERPSTYSAARARVQEIPEGLSVDPLSEDVAGRLDETPRQTDTELKEDR